MDESRTTFWLSPRGLAALGLIAATGYFLLTEHRAHAIAVLPWAILLLCPLLHLFMHRGHGGHGGGGGQDHDAGHTAHTDSKG